MSLCFFHVFLLIYKSALHFVQSLRFLSACVCFERNTGSRVLHALYLDVLFDSSLSLSPILSMTSSFATEGPVEEAEVLGA